MSARRRDALPGDEHARADHRAHLNQVAHREVGLARRAEIAHGRHAGLERPARVVLREKHGDSRPAPLPERARARRAVPVVGHVGVRVDQPWDTGVSPKVDDLGALRQIARPARDADDAVALDDHHRVGHHTRAIPEAAKTDCLLGLGDSGEREQEREQQRQCQFDHVQPGIIAFSVTQCKCQRGDYSRRLRISLTRVRNRFAVSGFLNVALLPPGTTIVKSRSLSLGNRAK